MGARVVTEADFRPPHLRDAKPEDYEFDGTGELVRKDRWEQTVRTVVGMFEDAGHMGVSRRRFELQTLVTKVGLLIDGEVLTRCQADCDGHCTHAKCPQRADKEPAGTGRHCPLDQRSDGD